MKQKTKKKKTKTNIKKKVPKKVSIKIKKEKGLICFCTKCKKRTKHKSKGVHWIKYSESCTVCGNVNYSEYLRENGNGNGGKK